MEGPNIARERNKLKIQSKSEQDSISIGLHSAYRTLLGHLLFKTYTAVIQVC